jgi:hypothetical protein
VTLNFGLNNQFFFPVFFIPSVSSHLVIFVIIQFFNIMRIVLSICIISIISSAIAHAQTCLPGGIIFETQKTVDSFPAYYPGCRVIEGSVTIQKDDIFNLDSLSILTTIKGDLIIQKTSQLISLHGLDHLDSIGGTINIKQNQHSKTDNIYHVICTRVPHIPKFPTSSCSCVACQKLQRVQNLIAESQNSVQM